MWWWLNIKLLLYKKLFLGEVKLAYYVHSLFIKLIKICGNCL